MKRLHEPNREGGYPVTGEALEILGVDMPNYVNAILDDITPENSIVFLSDRYLYFKSYQNQPNARSEIMQYTIRGGITKNAILQGAHFSISVGAPGYDDTINGTVYVFTRENVACGITPSTSSNHPTAYNLWSLMHPNTEVDYINSIHLQVLETFNGETTVMQFPVTITGHATVKDGYADIQLMISYVFEESNASFFLKARLPEVFSSYAGISTEGLLMTGNFNVGDYRKPDAVIFGTDLMIEGYPLHDGEWISIHFCYKVDEQ